MLPSHNTQAIRPCWQPSFIVEADRPSCPGPATDSEHRCRPVSRKGKSDASHVHPITRLRPLPALYLQIPAAPLLNAYTARQASWDRFPASPKGRLPVLVFGRRSGPTASDSLPRRRKRPWQGQATLSIQPQRSDLRNARSVPAATNYPPRSDTDFAGPKDGISTNRHTKFLELPLPKSRRQRTSRDLPA